MTPRASLEASQIESVLGLEPGALDPRSLRYYAPPTIGPPSSISARYPSAIPSSVTGEREIGRREWCAYWYAGVPEYVERELTRPREGDFLTLVACELWGMLPDRIRARGREWHKIARYASSGEAECPWSQDEAPRAAVCPMCEAPPDEAHGYVYIGEEWGETVYYSPPTMAELETE